MSLTRARKSRGLHRARCGTRGARRCLSVLAALCLLAAVPIGLTAAQTPASASGAGTGSSAAPFTVQIDNSAVGKVFGSSNTVLDSQVWPQSTACSSGWEVSTTNNADFVLHVSTGGNVTGSRVDLGSLVSTYLLPGETAFYCVAFTQLNQVFDILYDMSDALARAADAALLLSEAADLPADDRIALVDFIIAVTGIPQVQRIGTCIGNSFCTLEAITALMTNRQSRNELLKDISVYAEEVGQSRTVAWLEKHLPKYLIQVLTTGLWVAKFIGQIASSPAGYVAFDTVASSGSGGGTGSSEWTDVPLPLPGNADTTGASTLNSAACSSTTCSAVGTYQDSSGETQGLLLSGSGASWTASEAPIPVPTTDYRSAQVLAVACPSNCIAIGEYQDLDGGSHPMIWSSSTTGWTAIDAPVPGGQPNAANYLSAIACYSASACLVAGYYFDSSGQRQGWLLTWDGSEWTPSEAPLPANASSTAPDVVLGSAACASDTKCVAIGTYADSSGQYQNLILTGMGSSWTGTEPPLPANANDSNAGNVLDSVTCPSASTCVAVGVYTNSSSEAQPWIISGEGLSWTAADVSFPTDATNQTAVAAFALESVSCSSVTDCVASGVYIGSVNSFGQALLLTGAGTSWNAIDAPLPANNNDGASQLISAACQPGGQCVTAGLYFPVYNSQQGLIVSGNGTSWTPTEAPLPSNASTSDYSARLLSVACQPAAACVAVGIHSDTSGTTYGLLLTGPS